VLEIDKISDFNHLKQVAKLLYSENARLQKRSEELIKEIALLKGKDGTEQLVLELLDLQQRVNNFNQKMFAASSEKRSEKSADNSDTKTQKGHGPRVQPALPVVIEEFSIPKDELTCDVCGGNLNEWDGQFEESEDITVVERSFKVRKLKRKKYLCKCGECIKTAAGPVKPVKGGRYSLEFGVEVAVSKYLDHLPLSRQARIMKREGLLIDSQTLWDQIYHLTHHLKPTYDALKKHIQSSSFIHFDETRWFLLKKGGRKTWQIWSQSTPDAVHYSLLPGRSKSDAKNAIGDYSGTIVCDGYTVYKSIARDGPKKFRLAFCWAHVRRKFIEAEQNHSECSKAIAYIKELYKIESKLPDPFKMEGKPKKDALALRKKTRETKSKPIIDELEKWARKQKGLKNDGHMKAIAYMFNHFNGLKLFISDPALPIDNNHAERTVREPVVGRKNHYGSKSESGTKVAAIFYSLIETAKLKNIDPKQYLIKIATAAIKNPGTISLP
jgi:transposase